MGGYEDEVVRLVSASLPQLRDMMRAKGRVIVAISEDEGHLIVIWRQRGSSVDNRWRSDIAVYRGAPPREMSVEVAASMIFGDLHDYMVFH